MAEPVEIKSPLPWCKAYQWLGCQIFVTDAENGWHASISHPSRYPMWMEVCAIRDKFLPKDKTFAMILPPSGQYINVHPNCFHLYEIPNKQGQLLDVITDSVTSPVQ
jgi:hypothetical protein